MSCFTHPSLFDAPTHQEILENIKVHCGLKLLKLVANRDLGWRHSNNTLLLWSAVAPAAAIIYVFSSFSNGDTCSELSLFWVIHIEFLLHLYVAKNWSLWMKRITVVLCWNYMVSQRDRQIRPYLSLCFSTLTCGKKQLCYCRVLRLLIQRSASVTIIISIIQSIKAF